MDNYDVTSQLMHFDGLLNARELGGMPLKNGKVFPRNAVIRSDSPSDLTKEQCDNLKAAGITCVIDLRSEAEVRHYGNPFREYEGVDFYNIPLFIGDPDNENDPTINFLRTHLLGDFYVLILQQLGDRICRILKIISDNEGITMYHCAHGKDRTGIISAILYLLAGASRENIIRNYECSYTFMKPILDPLIATQEPGLKHILGSDAENMVIFLDYIEKKYGGDIKVYLKEQGMSDEDLDKLIRRIS